MYSAQLVQCVSFTICLTMFLTIGLDELKGLFQSKQFCDTMILWKYLWYSLCHCKIRSAQTYFVAT